MVVKVPSLRLVTFEGSVKFGVKRRWMAAQANSSTYWRPPAPNRHGYAAASAERRPSAQRRRAHLAEDGLVPVARLVLKDEWQHANQDADNVTEVLGLDGRQHALPEADRGDNEIETL